MHNEIQKTKVASRKKRVAIDTSLKVITYFASFLSVFILGAILFFVFSEGTELLSWSLIVGDNSSEVITMASPEDTDYSDLSFTYDEELGEDEYFSSRLGIVFINTTPIDENTPIIQITYMDPDSPLGRDMIDKGRDIKTGTYEGAYFGSIGKLKFDPADLTNGSIVLYNSGVYDDPTYVEDGVIYINEMNIENGVTVYDNGTIAFDFNAGAEILAALFDHATAITLLEISSAGGGIRGSIIATIWLILITILIALPLGVATSLFLHELAPNNRFFDTMRAFIDILNGVPSIIFGLMGAAVFIPLTQLIFGESTIRGYSILAGGLTMAIVVLPVVIKATEAALDVVPVEYKQASLALGATVSQTTFKVMLPNALPGILSATLLSIGRVIGESAALIFVLGVSIMDEISILGPGTSLAVHIWSVTAFDNPNLELATTIAIIILVIVLIMNLTVKLITYRFVKRFK